MFWTVSAGVSAIGRASSHTGSPIPASESHGKRRSSCTCTACSGVVSRAGSSASPAARPRLDVVGGLRLGLGRSVSALRRGQRPPVMPQLVVYASR